ncbi:hypothetical protein H4R34_002566, partial [Dimargaris verticillata]
VSAQGSTDEVILWLATIWHYLAHDHGQSVSDVHNGSFWDLGSTLANLVQLRYLINERFNIALTMAELWNTTRFQSMVQLIRKSLEALSQLKHPQAATKHAAVLYQAPLPTSRLSVWCQAQLYGTMGNHYHQQTVQWPSALSQSTVQTAIDHVVANHAQCRSSFVDEHGTVYQRIHAGTPVTIWTASLDDINPADSQTIDELADKYHGEFDPQVPGLLSAVLLTYSLEQYHAFLSVRIHPLIGDQTLVKSLVHELLVVCQSNDPSAFGLTTTILSALTRTPVLVDHHDEAQPDHTDYWTSIFTDAPWHLDLPDDRITLADPAWQFNTMSVEVAPSIHAALAAYADVHRACLTDVLGAITSLYVARISNQNEFMLGVVEPSEVDTPSSGQSGRGQSHMLPLFMECTVPSSLTDLVDLFRANHMAARHHYSDQAITLALARAGCQQTAVEQGLCRVSFAVINDCATLPTTPGERSIVLSHTSHAIQPDLQVQFGLYSDAMAIVSTYRRDRLGTALVSSLMNNLAHFIGKVTSIDCDPWAVPLVRPIEREYITQDLAVTPADPKSFWNTVTNVVDVIRANAAQHPDVVAIEMPSSSINYHDLMLRVDCVATSLHHHGVQPQQRVAVFVSNHGSTVVTLLALWTLGAVYVPVDGQLPTERQQYIIDTAQCTLVVNTVPDSCPWPGAILYGELLQAPTTSTASLPRIACYPFDPQDWAYIIFTSGTTGAPKGVPIRHAGLCNVLIKDYYDVCPATGTRVLQGYAAGFDASLFITMLTLCYRSTLVLTSTDMAAGLCQVTSAPMTPSMLASLEPREVGRLRNVGLGGEPIPRELIRKWHPHCQLYNGYGPTETAMVSHVARLAPAQRVAIGRPIANAPCYILDAVMNPVPVGVIGEIYIGGPGVSPGYVNRPDLNERKFVANPFGDGTLYATGDLGRWLCTKEVECLGRRDDQVKVRGFRVELDEIRNCLLAHPTINDAAVAILAAKQLVAFVCPATADSVVLLDHLVNLLPHYMIPGHMLPLPTIPKTANDKVNRQALDHVFTEYLASLCSTHAASAEPTDAKSQALVHAVADALQMARSTVNADLSYVQLGGDSISAVRLSAHLRRLGYSLPTPVLLQRIPLRHVGASMVPVEPDVIQTTALPKADQLMPLTTMQRWYFDQPVPPTDYAFCCVGRELHQPLSPQALNTALHCLASHHAALRCRFDRVADGQRMQRIAPASECEQLLVDSVTCDREQLCQQAVQLYGTLDIERGPLVRAALVQLSDKPASTVLILAAHRLVIDHGSWGILLEDLAEVLGGQPLPPVPFAYPTWVTLFPSESTHVSDVDTPSTGDVPLPSADWAVNATGNRTQEHSVTLPSALADALMQASATAACFQLSPFDLILTAWIQALSQHGLNRPNTLWHHDDQRSISTHAENRSRTVGWLEKLRSVGNVDAVAMATTAQAICLTKQALRTSQVLPTQHENCVLPDDDGLLLLRTVDLPAMNRLGQPCLALPVGLMDASSADGGKALGPWAAMITLFRFDASLVLWIQYALGALSQSIATALGDSFQRYLAALLDLVNQPPPMVPALWAPVDFPLLDMSFASLCQLEQELVSHQLRPAQVQTLYPLLPNLRGMLTATAKRASDYCNQFAITIRGLSSSYQLHQAVEQVVCRHEGLRSRFSLAGSDGAAHGVQMVLHPTTAVEWCHADTWTALGAQDEADYLAQNALRGFSVDGAMLRFAAIGKVSDNLRLIMTAHHAILDGWSAGLVVRDLRLVLNGSLADPRLSQPGHLQPFIAYRMAQDTSVDQTFWREYLNGLVQGTKLELPRPQTRSLAYAMHRLGFASSLDHLQSVAQHHGLTVHCLLAAAWALMLHTYTGQSDIVFGNTVSGRAANVVDVDRLVGCLVNVVPVRVQKVGQQTVRELLWTVQKHLLALVAFEHSHLSDIQAWVDTVPRGHRLFNTLLTFANFGDRHQANDAWPVTLEDVCVHGSTDFDLSMVVESNQCQQLTLTVGWKAAKFDASYVQQLANHYHQCIGALARCLEHHALDQRVVRTLVLSDHDHQQLASFSGQPCPIDPTLTVVDLLEAAVKRHPDTVAVAHGATQWCYSQLQRHATVIADRLVAGNVPEEAPVGILVRRCPATIAAMFGVLYARAAFVNIDPTHPEERIAFILADCSVRHLLYHSDDAPVAQAMADRLGITVYCMTTLMQPTGADQAISAYLLRPSPAHLAYILYTSGSTGRPKGAMMEHRGLANLAQQPIERTAIGCGTRYLQGLSLAFDASIYDVFVSLCAGATLVLSEELTDTLAMVDMAKLTPSILATLDPTHYPHLRRVIVAGEPLPKELAARWVSHCTVQNSYGPTECTVTATTGCYRMNDPVTIGQPWHNVQVYILDDHLQLVPVGVMGEICIGGPGVMRGYVNQPEQTQRALVTNPLMPQDQLYRTGDLGRWLISGEIEYLGRRDDQVKLHGRRVELHEIEAVLERHPAVATTVVLVIQGQLWAFVCPLTVDTNEMLDYAKQQLPAYMVPTHSLALTAFPLTGNGKVDKQALQQQAQLATPTRTPPARPITAPRDAREHTMVHIMAQTLGISADLIGIDDSFFALGGDSLLAIQLSTLARAHCLRLSVAHVFQYPTPQALAQVCAPLPIAHNQKESRLDNASGPFALLVLSGPQRDELLDEAHRQLGVTTDAIADILPPSGLQNGFIVSTLKDPSAYMVQLSYRIRGALDASRYRACWQQVGLHHSMLRTKFVITDLVPGHSALQVVLTVVDMAWSFEQCATPLQDDFEQQFLLCDRQHGFAFDGRPLLRVAVRQIAPHDHYLFVTFHHALMDAWSTRLVLAQVLALYHGQALPPATPYGAFVALLADQPKEAAQKFWHDLLRNIKPTPDLQLPMVQPLARNTSRPTFGVHSLTLQPLLSTIHGFCQRLGITTNTLLRGLWALLLARYLNTTHEVTFGVLVSGRNEPLAGIDQLVGLCVNTVPFRVQVGRETLAHQWLQGLHRQSGAIMPHEHTSLVQVHRWAQIPADIPLFQSLLVYDKYPQQPTTSDTSQIQCDASDGINYTEYPLTASFDDTDHHLRVTLVYDTCRYDGYYAAQLAHHLDAYICRLLASQATSALASINPVADTQWQILQQWAGHCADFQSSPNHCLHALFTRQLQQRSHAPAVDHAGQQWTYAQVNALAQTVARQLVAHGLCAGDKVALFMTRSPEFIITLLGALMVGMVCVPLEGTSAVERNLFILQDLGTPVVLTTVQFYATLVEACTSLNATIVCLNNWVTVDAVPRDLDTCSSLPTVDSQGLAYIIYTSGTTGKPKGVMVRHESAHNCVKALTELLELTPDCRLSHNAPIAFDACLMEIFCGFAAGATLVLRGDDFGESMQRVTATTILPAHLTVFDPRDFPNLELMITGTDAVTASGAHRWSRHLGLYNVYGPTETSIATHLERVAPDQPITIGRPIANITCYILDDWLQPVPIGVVGQIAIGGIGVSNGYWNRPELTAKVFVPNPFGRGQLYLTGDLGCWLPTGKVKHLGRQDFQVKLRGFRVELGEIEAVADAVDSVTASVALVRDHQLVLYVTPETVAIEPLRRALATKLPHYMVPTHIGRLAELPLTPIGKVDRKSLLARSLPLDDDQNDAVELPAHGTEDPAWQVLREALVTVLNVDAGHVQPSSSFFRLGGDSISAIQLMTKCKRQGLYLTVPLILNHPQLDQMVQHARWAPNDVHNTPKHIDEPVGLVPPTAIQRWFMTGEHPSADHFNQSFVLRCRHRLDSVAVRTALLALIAHHDVLRLQAQQQDGAWQQTVLPVLDSSQALAKHLHFETVTLAMDEVDDWLAHLHVQPNLASARHVSGGLVSVNQDQFLVLVIHHLVVDLVSWRILLEDLEALLLGQPLPAKTLSFRQWAHHIQEYAATLSWDTWPTYPPVAPLPMDLAVATDPVPTFATCQTERVYLDVASTNQLFDHASAMAATAPQEFMLAALALSITSTLGVDSMELELESHGRYPWSEHGDVSRTVGWFTSVYPLPLHLSVDNPTSAEALYRTLRQVKHRVHAVPHHGLPYELLRQTQPTTEPLTFTTSRSVVFNYVGRFDQLTTADAFWRVSSDLGNRSHDFHPLEPFTKAFLATCAHDPQHGLSLSLVYSTAQYSPSTVQTIARGWVAALGQLLAAVRDTAEPCLALADFPLLAMTEAQFDLLMHRDLVAAQVGLGQVAALYPCLPLQEGLILAVDHNPTAYTVQSSLTVRGELDVPRFQAAWAQLVALHPILRTSFLRQLHCQAYPMLQLVLKEWLPPWTTATWEGLDPVAAEAQYRAADLARGFDWTRPLLRLGLFAVSSHEYRLIITVHHAMLDGWSLAVMLTDVLALYYQSSPPVPGQYQAVVQHVLRQDSSTHAAFWQDYLQHITAPLYLPSPLSGVSASPTKRVSSISAAKLQQVVGPWEPLARFTQAQGITISTVLRAAWAILLQRYTAQAHLLFGVTVSGRNLPVDRMERVVGLCINTIPCTVHITPTTTLQDLLHCMHTAGIQAMPHEHHRLNDIHRLSAVDNGQPLFNSLLVVENYPSRSPTSNQTIAIESNDTTETTEYPLTILAGVEADQLGFVFSYHTQTFPETYVHQVAQHYASIIQAIMASPGTALVYQLTMLSREDEQLLLTQFATNPSTTDRTFAHQAFLLQATHQPHALAIQTGDGMLTYRRVQSLARVVAHQLLVAATVGPDSLVAIVAGNSAELVVCQLAVWMAGAAFVVIDPAYPQERQQFIVEDAQCVAVLDASARASALGSNRPTIAVNWVDLGDTCCPVDSWPEPNPTSLAWVIYTSGSTGQPKGVMIEHGSAANHFQVAGDVLGIDAGTITPILLTPTFDVSISEIWTTLSHGGSVLLANQDIHIVFAQVERVCCTPSLLAALNPVDFPNLQRVTTTGEPITQRIIDTWAPHVELTNWYGPTEVTVVSHYARLAGGGPAIVGRPLPNAVGYILDAQLRPVPVGVVGELYLGGKGVARGYLNRPALSAEKFLANPFGPGRLFKSGDLARWLPDGNVQCLGRRDNQVKVRGYRIELDEVTNTLAQCNGVHQACVVVQGSHLIGYVSPAAMDTQAAMAYVKTRLPHYMVPAALVALSSLPLTLAGKVDKQGLPQYRFDLPSPHTGMASRTAQQDRLIRIVADVLAIPQVAISPHDTFFQLGGDSLAAIRLSTACRAQGLTLRIPRLFERPALADVAEYALQEASEPCAPDTVAPPTPLALLKQAAPQTDVILATVTSHLCLARDAIEDVLPTTSLQEELLINTLKDPSAYMVQTVLEITGALDVDRYYQAWRAVFYRHSILRTKFVITDCAVPYDSLQVVTRVADFAWHYEALPVTRYVDRAGAEQTWFTRDRQQGFHLDGSPLFRLALVAWTPNQHLLFLSFHHALLDAWSASRLLHETLAVYHAQTLPAALQYCAFVRHLHSLDPHASQRFWRRVLKGVVPTPAPAMPDEPTHEPTSASHAAHMVTITTELPYLHQFCAQRHITLHTLLRAVWSLTLARYMPGATEVTFGTLVSGRNVPLTGIESMVGLTLNTVPFRAFVHRRVAIHAWLQDLHRLSGEIMAHEHASLLDIARWASLPHEQPLFQTLLVLTAAPEPDVAPAHATIAYREGASYNETEYPLTVLVAEQGQQLRVTLQYRCDHYSPQGIAYLGAYLDHCIGQLVQSCATTLVDATWSLPSTEATQVALWSQGVVSQSPDPTRLLDALFTANLARRPQALALEALDAQWTYAEAAEWVASFMAHLEQRGVQPQSKVLLLFARSPYYVLALLAILTMGAVYVPVDASNGVQRIRTIWQDLGQPLVVTARQHRDVVASLAVDPVPVVFADAPLPSAPTTPMLNYGLARTPADLAYIIYTSGTTGKPKGVLVRHESATNVVIHLAQTMGLTASHRCLQALNPAFDVCVAELFATFYAGGTVVLAVDSIPAGLTRVDVAHLTPSLLASLDPRDYAHLRMATSSGEALPTKTAAQWLKTCQLYNVYGPTEATIASHIEPLHLAGPVTIGRPIPNTECHILDDCLQPVPVGVPGQICLGGLGISNGYWQRPELTAKVFVPNPLGSGTLYLTGDRGCWLPSGKVKYLGRTDFQVKLRGFRIELGEVEHAILQHPAVHAACVAVQDDNLVAYATPDTLNVDSVRRALGQRLPPYMIPSVLVALAQLPLTPVGKVDRRALPRVDVTEHPRQVSLPTATPVQRQLMAAVAKVLQLDSALVGLHHTFFQLGGNSLSAIRLASALGHQGLALEMAAITRTATLADLAADLRPIDPALAIEPYPTVEGPVLLTPIQWEFLRMKLAEPRALLSPLLLECRHTYPQAQWQRAFHRLVSHHDMLRYRLPGQAPCHEPCGYIDPTQTHTATLHWRLASSPWAMQQIVRELCATIDYLTGPVCQGAVLTMNGTQYFFFVAHHLVFDQVSASILAQDLQALLQQRALPPKTLSYPQWATTLRHLASTLDPAIGQRFHHAPPLPLDYAPLPAPQVASQATLRRTSTTFEGPQLQAMTAWMRQAEVTAPELLLTALLLATTDVFHQTSLNLAVESHGRSIPHKHCDVSRTVGWFVHYQYLTLAQRPGQPLSSVLAEAQQAIRQLPTQGFELFLAKHLGPMAGDTQQLLSQYRPDVAFAYNDAAGTEAAINDGHWQARQDMLTPLAVDLLPNVFPYRLIITCQHQAETLTVTVAYHTHQYQLSTMDRLLGRLEAAVGLFTRPRTP